MENQFQTQETAPPLQKLPNATLTLILGILSVISCCCCGGLGIVPAVIALILSAKSNKLLKENPNGYSDAGNHKAGRIIAIIGLVFNVLGLFYNLFNIIVYGGIAWIDAINNTIYDSPYYY